VSMVKGKKKRGCAASVWVLFGGAGVILIGIGFFIYKIVTTDVGPRRKNVIAVISLVKPPPVKEKLPEPEVQKIPPKQSVEQVIESPQNTPQDSPPENDAPPGADLGVEGEGGAGSDGFGLVGKKGGKALIGGGAGGTGSGGRLSLMAKYGWYTKKIQDDVRSRIKQRLDKDGGFPKGKYQALVKIILDRSGAMVDFRIVGPSGSDRMDGAIREILGTVRLSEPPPEGMPTGMTIKISSQG